MSAQSQESTPADVAPVPAKDADAEPTAPSGPVRREVELLPDGRRITYYASSP